MHSDSPFRASRLALSPPPQVTLPFEKAGAHVQGPKAQPVLVLDVAASLMARADLNKVLVFAAPHTTSFKEHEAGRGMTVIGTVANADLWKLSQALNALDRPDATALADKLGRIGRPVAAPVAVQTVTHG